MNNITRDFITDDNRKYRFKIGHVIASSLSGFLCGFIVATIIWVVLFKYVLIP